MQLASQMKNANICYYHLRILYEVGVVYKAVFFLNDLFCNINISCSQRNWLICKKIGRTKQWQNLKRIYVCRNIRFVFVQKVYTCLYNKVVVFASSIGNQCLTPPNFRSPPWICTLDTSLSVPCDCAAVVFNTLYSPVSTAMIY
jgi:hypothetical protein